MTINAYAQKSKISTLIGLTMLAIATLIVASTSAVFAAKEPGSGGTTTATGTTTCSNVQSFTVKGDSRVRDGAGFGTIDVSYSVKPCDKTQVLSVGFVVSDYYTGEVVYQYDNAPQSGSFTYYGAQPRKLYKVTLNVTDAANGQSEETAVRVVSIPAIKP